MFTKVQKFIVQKCMNIVHIPAVRYVGKQMGRFVKYFFQLNLFSIERSLFSTDTNYINRLSNLVLVLASKVFVARNNFLNEKEITPNIQVFKRFS